VPRQETLGERIRRLRQQRGLSLAKVSGEDFSRAFLNQVEMGRSQPSTRVLRVIAGRLGTEVDYLLEGRPPNLDRELALERARILVARGQARRALSALAEAGDATDWQLHTDARLCQAEALRAIGSSEEADAIIAGERRVITAHRDAHRRLADRALRAARGADALEHYRAARVLLEV
jgi:transcriptional regulator with XRE-family HTH domain